jgi:hypothetical protein
MATPHADVADAVQDELHDSRTLTHYVMLRDPAARVAFLASCPRPVAWAGRLYSRALMPERRFPPPWTVEEYRGISYIVRDENNFPLLTSISSRSRVDALLGEIS